MEGNSVDVHVPWQSATFQRVHPNGTPTFGGGFIFYCDSIVSVTDWRGGVRDKPIFHANTRLFVAHKKG